MNKLTEIFCDVDDKVNTEGRENALGVFLPSFYAPNGIKGFCRKYQSMVCCQVIKLRRRRVIVYVLF